MDTQTNSTLSSEDKTALGQLQQKASNLHQSSSNNFLVSLEGLMLAAIAWESLDKPKAWLRNLSKATTAIGLAVTGIFAINALRDRAQASKVERKLKQYGVDELTLPSEMGAAAPAPTPAANPATRPIKPSVPFMDQADTPQTAISTDGAELARMQPANQMAI